jgi:NodT family efflux transporter outer membrane factor (OMF) lipoprotein
VQNYYTFGFDMSWELDFFGRLRRLKEAAYFDLEASWENMRGVYITLLAEVSVNYSLFRALQKRIDIALEQIQAAEDLLSLSEVRYRAGLRSDIEPSQAKSVLDALKATLPPLDSDLTQTVYNIAVLLGRQPEDFTQSWFEARPIPMAAGKIPLGIPSDLLRQRPDIRQAERELAAAVSRVGAAIAELFPTFSLTASYGIGSTHMQNLFKKRSQFWSVGPSVFWPVIDFGRIRSHIDFQNAAQAEALLSYEQTILQALEEVEDALVAYMEEEKRLNDLENQVLDLIQSRDLTRALYQAGLRSLTDYLDAEEQVLLAEQSFISSQQFLSADLIAIYKSLGGDWTCSNTP